MLADIRQPSIMQILKNAGFDFVIIDNEHGVFGIESIADLSRMARILGLTVVRVPDLAYPYVAQSLDAGPQGIMLPPCDPPRPGAPGAGHHEVPAYGQAVALGHEPWQTDFRAGPLMENMAYANSQSLLMIQIETAESLQHLDEIVQIEGVDSLFVGPTRSVHFARCAGAVRFAPPDFIHRACDCKLQGAWGVLGDPGQ